MRLVGVSIYDVLAGLRATALSESEKGAKFERLMKAFLTTDPVYAEQFKDVRLWTEWPGRQGKHDTGVDLVAQDRLTEAYVAIQCKFYAPTSTIGKEDIDSFLSASGKEGFSERIIVSTTDRWNGHAEDAIKSQQIPVRRIGMSDLEASPIDWGQFTFDTPEVLPTVGKKAARPHQAAAIDAARAGFAEHDRGKLIMACGTGKTFTSLRLAEEMVGAGGSVLFLVPSISLLSQTLREWCVEAEVPLHPIAVCSDRKSTARSKNIGEDIATVDLALPATTNMRVLSERLITAAGDGAAMTVVFSTYQSIDVLARAQAEGGVEAFDLIICDEAHRTTGMTLVDDADESVFVRVHNSAYLKGAKRLYMTATPRIYDDASKAKAGEAEAVLASMDNEDLYGPEFYRLGFGDAVARDLLTDYKVLVLAVDEKAVATTFQSQLADEHGELKLDDAAKIVGCWNGLAKRGHVEHGFESDPAPMRRAVAFAGTIKASRKVEALFERIVNGYLAAQSDDAEDVDGELHCEVRHVDGTFNALERNSRLDWLRDDVSRGKCRVLTNARCLSEGVDVPGLDAVMFLSPRRSVVDVVQSVGRVMRKAPGKHYGYIILPVGIPADMTPEVALRDNTRYQVVWEVLQALRAHDDRFNAEVNKIDLTKHRSDRINVIGCGAPVGDTDSVGTQGVQQTLALDLSRLEEWRENVYARIVKKVGSRRYWEDWASDVARIAETHITRISALLEDNRSEVAEAFETFLDGLRANLNESITRTDAIEMLAQHLITRPVFDALFGGYDFTAHNPVAQTMEQMLAALDEHALASENETLEKFYASVRQRVQGIDTADGRQRIIVELYDKFFSTAFKRTVNKLGIVYTPVEIVDFILNSADEVLKQEFGEGLTDQNVHILDGFTGTGTFMVRLLQSGLITATDLPRKYQNELHANEILLLAYYIAAVNIESTFQDITSDHLTDQTHMPFPGLILTDTFQSWETDDRLDYAVFQENNQRLERLKRLPITVIVGNPPYSVGQESANDDNANESYPTLDRAIRESYAAKAAKASIRGLYDSYVRAIKWASLRIGDRGVIAYVTNGGFLDSASGDGMRKALAEDFSAIHIFNLRGNRRNAGAEGRPVFEAYAKSKGGSIAGIAIVVLVKNPGVKGDCRIRYAQVADFMTAQQKLQAVVTAGSMLRTESRAIVPNAAGDWLGQRREDFAAFAPLYEKGTMSVFGLTSKGLTTNRDAWIYGSSRDALANNVERMIHTYSSALNADAEPTKDPRQISWSRRLLTRLNQRQDLAHQSSAYRLAMYRPFQQQHVYFSTDLNEDRQRLPLAFPTASATNCGFLLTGVASHYAFAAIATASIPDLHLLDTGQFFPRWRYVEIEDDATLGLAFEDSEVVDGYRRVDNITEQALTTFRERYGDTISKDDIFYYAYGLLHSAEYRQTYAADLKKGLPRLPLVSDPHPFINSGQALFELHLGYESAEPFPLTGLDVDAEGDPYDFYRVAKMAFPKLRVDGKLVADKTKIRYNSRIELSDIPEEVQRYELGPRTAVEWLIERYQVRTDKDSGIVNDPNDWAREKNNPRFVLDLVARIVTVSVETVKVVEALPALDIPAAT